MARPLLLFELGQELLEEGAIVSKVQPADSRRAILVRGLEDPQKPGPAIGAGSATA